MSFTNTMSILGTSHLFNHLQDKPEYAKEEEDCHWCQLRKWPSHELYPVGIKLRDYRDPKYNNELEILPGLPLEFKFIDKNIYCEGVELAPEEFRTGCECRHGVDCMKEGCNCLQDIDVEPDFEGTKINAYHVVGDRAGCLREHMLHSRKPIYECHDKCSCTERCPNRVVSKGRKVRLLVFESDNGRGWGLQTRTDIKKGQYVGSYVGEVITADEARKRREAAELAKKKDIYMFALDKFTDPDSNDSRLAGEPYEIDGEFFSGPTRFINHSCEPNLRIFAVVTDHANKPFHELCFFALRQIEKGEELTFDYTDGIRSDEGESIDERKLQADKKGALTKCLCGAQNCRGYLW